MNTVCHSCSGRRCRDALVRHLFLTAVVLWTFGARASGTGCEAAGGPVGLQRPFVLTQLPAGTGQEKEGTNNEDFFLFPFSFCLEAARLLLVSPDGSTRVLSKGFHGACDPDVSFDAKRILFAGKRTASDRWNIYEMTLDGDGLRQITRDQGDCRSPNYQSTLYTIVSPQPWYQLTFVGNRAGTRNEDGSPGATHLYSCKLDGSAIRRLTFNLSSDVDPHIMSDGRLVYASWQRRTLDRGLRGRVALFGVDLDGTDCALFAAEQTKRIRRMPCETTGGLVVFVEADQLPWDGGGSLASVQVRRPLHSYRQITRQRDGLFHSPSPLPDGNVLVSRRPRDGKGTHGVYRLDPVTGKMDAVFDDPDYHDLQAKSVAARPVPDGCSSVVTETDPHGRLYCLNVYDSDLSRRAWMPPGGVKAVRVLEGIPVKASDAAVPARVPVSPRPRVPASGRRRVSPPPLAKRRLLGQVPVAADGSFNIEVPADTPIELQLLDADGLAVRSCGWIWVKNHEPRGCIGCHEDGELTPENQLADALNRPSIPLCLPPARRRTVDFRRDVMPIIEKKCIGCHRRGDTKPRLDGVGQAFQPAGYVQPGKARTSRLVWRMFGRNTSRPWDGAVARTMLEPAPRCKAGNLTEDEKQAFVEWIDMGASWDGIPGPDDLPGGKKTK